MLKWERVSLAEHEQGIGAVFIGRTRAGIYDGYWTRGVIPPEDNEDRDMGGKFCRFTCFGVGFGIRPGFSLEHAGR